MDKALQEAIKEVSEFEKMELERLRIEKMKKDLKAVKVVTMDILTDYLMMCKEDCWTKEGWDKLFVELESTLAYAD